MTMVLVISAATGQPIQWVTQNEAISQHALQKVVYQIGDPEQFVFHGGMNRITGAQSILASAPIIAIQGVTPKGRTPIPPISNSVLFKRDGRVCIYCGQKFNFRELTREHLHPRSKGGGDHWLNLATSCKMHNNMKGNMTHDEFCYRYDISPMYLPYIPSFSEYLFLQEYDYALPSQVEYLMGFFPSVSRIRNLAERLI